MSSAGTFPVVTYLQYPGSVAAEHIAGVDEVSMAGEAGQHVLQTLLERVDLRVHQDLGHHILRGELDQTLSCGGRGETEGR